MLGAAGNNELCLGITRMFHRGGGTWLKGCITQRHDRSFPRTFASRKGKKSRSFSICRTLYGEWLWDGSLCFRVSSQAHFGLTSA